MTGPTGMVSVFFNIVTTYFNAYEKYYIIIYFLRLF